MPLYEYECEACAHRFEVIQKFSDPLVEKCPVCGGHVRKLPSSPAIQFKGSGWYITDYAKKDQTPASTTEGKKSDAAADAKPAGAAAETKSDKSETKTDSGGDAKPAPKSDAS